MWAQLMPRTFNYSSNLFITRGYYHKKRSLILRKFLVDIPTLLKGKYNRNLNPHNFPKTAPRQENKLGLCLKLSNNSTHSSSHLCMIHVASLCAGVHADSLTGLPGTLPMIQARGIWVEGIAFEKMSAPDWSVGKPVVNFHGWWLMWKGLVHYGACHPWAYGPGVFKKAG